MPVGGGWGQQVTSGARREQIFTGHSEAFFMWLLSQSRALECTEAVLGNNNWKKLEQRSRVDGVRKTGVPRLGPEKLNCYQSQGASVGPEV